MPVFGINIITVASNAICISERLEIFLTHIFCFPYTPLVSSLIPRNLLAVDERLQNQRPTLVVPPDVSTSVKEICIGNVLFLETLLVKFSHAPKPFRRKDELGWVWGFFIYLFVGSFKYPERGGELSF